MFAGSRRPAGRNVEGGLIVVSAAGRFPGNLHVANLLWLTDRSRCHPVFAGSRRPAGPQCRGGLIACQRRVQASLGNLHVADLLCETDRSRCHWAFAGSILASRSAIASEA